MPGAAGGGGITRFPIDARQLQTECGRGGGFVFGRDQTMGFGFVAGLKGFLLAGLEVFAVINTPRPEEYTVALFHVIFHGYEHEPIQSGCVSE